MKVDKGSVVCRLGYGDIVSFTEGFPGCMQIAMSIRKKNMCPDAQAAS